MVLNCFLSFKIFIFVLLSVFKFYFYENLGGHLAEIKSEEQNTFLVSLAMLEENLIHTQSWQIGECEIFSILHARVSSYRHTIFLDRPE